MFCITDSALVLASTRARAGILCISQCSIFYVAVAPVQYHRVQISTVGSQITERGFQSKGQLHIRKNTILLPPPPIPTSKKHKNMASLMSEMRKCAEWTKHQRSKETSVLMG